MGIFSNLFKKRKAPEPYDWAFLRERCLLAIESRVAPADRVQTPLDGLDFPRLEASGDAAEEVVVEIWAVLRGAKLPALSVGQSKEFLYHAGELLRTAPTPEFAATGLKEIEERVRRK